VACLGCSDFSRGKNTHYGRFFLAPSVSNIPLEPRNELTAACHSVTVPAIIRIGYFHNITSSADITFIGITPFICNQVEMHFGTMATTIPCLRPFVKSFNTGWGTLDTQGVGGYAMTDIDSKKSKSRTGSSKGLNSGAHSTRDQLRPDFISHRNRITAVPQLKPESQTSRTWSNSSERMIIQKTISTDIQFDEPTTCRDSSGQSISSRRS